MGTHIRAILSFDHIIIFRLTFSLSGASFIFFFVKIKLGSWQLVMKHELVNKSGQMESLVACVGMLYKGHRCGACHNASDAKVRIMTKQDKEPKCSLKVSVYVRTFC